MENLNNNLYLIAVTKAFKEFLEDESQGAVFSEEKLLKKIKAAQCLFPQERQIVRNISRNAQ